MDTSTPKNISFRVAGLATQAGLTYESNRYEVQVADPSAIKDVYYGVSDKEAANIDLSTFSKVPYTHSGQIVTFTLSAQTGQYYYLFVPHDPGVDKIINPTLGDFDVTAEWSTPPGGQKLENAQTIGGVSLDSFRRGPVPGTGQQDVKVVML
jgi:hypothetical protein